MVITEGIPVADTAYCVALARQHNVRIVGPNCPGLSTYTSADEQTEGLYGVNLGIIPDGIVSTGSLGLVSKSGTLTYQLMSELADYGFRAAIGVGGDSIIGTTQQEALEFSTMILRSKPAYSLEKLVVALNKNSPYGLVNT